MRRIAHLSDLHFGREDALVVKGLLKDLDKGHVDVVAISGDLTQRARRSQFRRARAFLDDLPAPYVVVPGNHDIPFYDFFRRVTRPLKRYKRHITDDLTPTYADDELAVVGMNTARALALKEGRLSLAQIARVPHVFGKTPDAAFKAFVAHHPFVPSEKHKASLVHRAGLGLKALEKAGVDLMMTGHTHRSFVGDARRHHRRLTRSILVSQTGTSVSTRTRNEPNHYARITVKEDRVAFQERRWLDDAWVDGARSVYERRGPDWTPVERSEENDA